MQTIFFILCAIGTLIYFGFFYSKDRAKATDYSMCKITAFFIVAVFSNFYLFLFIGCEIIGNQHSWTIATSPSMYIEELLTHHYTISEKYFNILKEETIKKN